MVKVTEEMKALLVQGLAFAGTADREGKPNIAHGENRGGTGAAETAGSRANTHS